ncbi:MAG TPA: sugar ABC transporter ATP-binding protein [Bradyrhizobium sp.]|jgi:ABC-type sugar transport system ATPase subunit|nr:sugar ABC transporter ATP-binding protein [Bradyrhizobium sp.]
MPILAVDGVTKRFGPNEVLKNVSLSLGAQEIRAICGENGAGKSTLVKIITGVHAADGGTVLVDGTPTEITDPQHAQELGIALVAQELSLAPALSVFDNIWLGNREVPLFHRRKELRERARAALEKVGLEELPLEAPVSRLSIGRRQLVELARMLTRDARVFILDEPTATLSDVEIERIFAALRALKDEGKSVIYITHRLGEVFQICDSVSVLRNGELVGTRRTAEIDRAQLMEMMLGRSLREMYPRYDSRPGQPMLEVRDLWVPPVVQNFNLTAQRGMVICLAGQVGSGATEVLRALAGLAFDSTGEVGIAGQPVQLRSVMRAQRAKMQFISEDRAGEGVFLRLNVGQNLVATRLGDHSRLGILARRGLRATAAKLAAAVGVDRARLRSQADELSGGNQQKVAFGRVIGGDEPGVLLMNEPTRGVDVGARADIYRLIRQFCDRGYCLVMASSDIEEVLGMADVIVSMYRGRQVATYQRGEADLHRVLADITHPVAAA